MAERTSIPLITADAVLVAVTLKLMNLEMALSQLRTEEIYDRLEDLIQFIEKNRNHIDV